jgi:diketogulonate reductase-like aldo/keto reductase
MSITESLKASLSKIGVDYLDLYLIHSASLVTGRISEAWAEMEALSTSQRLAPT